MEDKIKYIFENTNNWLNFAEAKNAALLAFNIAVITAITSSEILVNSSKVLVYTVSAILIVSSLMSMISFIPKTNNAVSQKLYNCTIGIIDRIITRIFKENVEEIYCFMVILVNLKFLKRMSIWKDCKIIIFLIKK